MRFFSRRKALEMALIVSALGALVAGLGVMGVVRPARLMRLVTSVFRTNRGIYFAVGLRLVFGIVLIVAASDCHFTVAVRILGIVAIAAAVIMLLLGVERVRRLIIWWLTRAEGFIRAWAFVAVAFGLFLVYAGAWPN